MHYYQFNIGDYKSHTEHLSEMEDLTYRRLLDWYYLHETPIPLDLTETARQIRMRSHSDCIALVLQEYFERTDDGWIHHRANAEILKAGDKSQKASESAKARWKKKDANALQTQSERNATHNTLHTTQDTKHKKKATVVAAPDGVSFQTWEDFKTLRKAKKAPITQRALDGLIAESEKAGWSLEQALTECVMRGWQAFKADWVNKSLIAPVNKFDVAHITTPTPKNHDAALRKIEEDAKKAAPMPEFARELAKKWKEKA